MAMLPQLGISKHFGMLFAQRFSDGHKEPAGSASRIADDVCGLRLDHLDHQPDAVPRRSKLAVLTGAGNLAQHVFVEIALGLLWGLQALLIPLRAYELLRRKIHARLLDFSGSVLFEKT